MRRKTALTLILVLSNAGCSAQRMARSFAYAPAHEAPLSSSVRDSARERNGASAAGRSVQCSALTAIVDARSSPVTAGSLTATVDSNNQPALHIKVENLVPPAKLGPNLTTYVVWVRPACGGNYRNAGQLKMGIHRTGRLSTPSTLSEVELLVTAESLAVASEPSQYVVAQSAVSRR